MTHWNEMKDKFMISVQNTNKSFKCIFTPVDTEGIEYMLRAQGQIFKSLD